MARHGHIYKDRVVARLLPPESSPVEVISREVGVSASTLERWRAKPRPLPRASHLTSADTVGPRGGAAGSRDRHRCRIKELERELNRKDPAKGFPDLDAARE